MSDELTGETSAESFERLYRQAADPWAFASSAYELDRYAAILRALSRNRYDYAFEPGCSVGVLTARLATRCRNVMAMDIAQSAVLRARRRCCALTNVEVRMGDVNAVTCTSQFDLIVFSEIGYYFTPTHLCAIAENLSARLGVNGEFIACHWLGHSNDHVLHGDEVHSALNQALSLTRCHSERHEQYRIDTWTRS